MDTADAAEEFLDHCRYRGLADSTLTSYRWGLGRLAAACPELPVAARDVMRLLGDRTPSRKSGRALAHESRRDLARILGTFFRWASREYKFPNPMSELDPLRRRRQLPRVLQEAEIRALLEACESRRDRAMVMLALDTGIRLGELAGLRWSDVGPDYIRVGREPGYGKTGERQVPITPRVKRALLGLGDGDRLWLGPKGPLTKSGVRQVFERLFFKASIARAKNGAHALRHTFGTWYIRGGGNVKMLQDILGHTSLSTTMLYVTLAGRDVAADHRLHSPVVTLDLLDPASDDALELTGEE